ncbi:MAG TPA: hypothetical protein VG125_26720 [Pirellulales bacterium]|jgi:hypothetical protein|nr:hypothetical protein [Pirellulales bacterium]
MPTSNVGTTIQSRLPQPPSLSRLAWLALAAVLAAGVVLRLVWLDDIEYKTDEEWTWRHAQAAGRSEPMSWVGMPTSAGPENPGMSLWVFIPLRWLGEGPVDLARGVACLSIAALLLTVLFAWRWVPPQERETWLWAAALSAVNPLSVLHHRKIWPPCAFPLLGTLFVICWWHRDRRVFAFGWGVLGAVLAQINLSAGFFAAAFVLWSWFAGRQTIAWKSWLLGSALASLPLIPWFVHVSTVSTQPHLTTLKWTRLLEGKFFFRWISEPFGMGLDHALGDDHLDFLRQPFLGDAPTYLVGILHLLALSIALAVGWRWLRDWFQRRRDWRAALFPADSTTALVCSASLWGYGVLLTLTCLPLHRQYTIIVYFIELLWVAHSALRVGGGAEALKTGRRLLGGLVVVQLLISASFLGYVHVKQVIHGDYGVALCAQQARSDGPVKIR